MFDLVLADLLQHCTLQPTRIPPRGFYRPPALQGVYHRYILTRKTSIAPKATRARRKRYAGALSPLLKSASVPLSCRLSHRRITENDDQHYQHTAPHRG